MSVSRRTLLKTAAAAAFAPPVLSAARASDGFIELIAGPAKAQLLAGGQPQTEVWAYGGGVPGPVLRARQGEPFRLRFINRLPQPSTIHWHGIRIANAMDGVAGLTQDAVPPGESFDYVFTPPDAGTYWYHPHSRTWEQLARGLYGALIVEEQLAPGFDADIPLLLDDWRLTKEGAIHEASLGGMMDFSHAGRLGNWVTVNGTSLPSLELPAGGLARLRLINTSNARVLDLKLGDFSGHIIAYDGQPIDPVTIPASPVALAPAQR
ncbi:MAG: multicopper oxidase domain-containing protein, partial [Pseudomonadota bacterium]